MTRLIDETNIKTYKGLSNNINVAKELYPHIDEAQEFDLRPWLGESFYLWILDTFENTPTDADLVALLEGGVYTYDGENYENPGLNKVLSYLSYARYSILANAQSTPTGFVQKTNQYSDPISGAQLTRITKQNESASNALQQRVEDFLNRNSTTYPLWENSCKGNRKKSIRINKIGKQWR
jgi:hypothetical protein